jgi:nucleoside-diphosphate-sugar epimerase
MEASMGAVASCWQGRRVLVTGCTSFLGGEVTRELTEHGASVIGLIRERGQGAEFVREIAAGQVRLILGCVEDAARVYSAMAVHEVSAVFHLDDSEQSLAAVERAANLYLPRVPVILPRPPVQLRLAGVEPHSSVGLGVARFGEIFGPGDRSTSRLVPRALQAILSGEPVVPSGGASRDFVFVRDAARACLLLAEAVGRAGHSLDCAFRSGWEFSDSEMARLLANSVAGQRVDVVTVQPPNPLSWRPETSLADAVDSTVAWYRKADPTLSTRSNLPPRRAA